MFRMHAHITSRSEQTDLAVTYDASATTYTLTITAGGTSVYFPGLEMGDVVLLAQRIAQLLRPAPQETAPDVGQTSIEDALE